MNNPDFIPVGQQMLTASLAHIAEHRADLDKGGESAWAYRLLLEAAEKNHKKLETVIGLFVEYGEGLQLRHAKHDRWAFLLSDASEPGRCRYQLYQPTGFITHRTFNTWEEALQEVAKDGYVIEDNGSLDQFASTLAWARSTEIDAAVFASNTGAIDWPEYLRRTAEIKIRYDTLEAAQAQEEPVDADEEDEPDSMSMR